MKIKQISRRRFTQGLAFGCLASPAATNAILPIKRNGPPRLKLSLAAYSFRKQLTAKTETPGAMDMMGFIDWCATQDLDAFEPTSYFFPKKITPGYLAQMKRKAHLHGLDVSSGAIRNVFTLPDGPELDKWHDHVDTWVDHYAAIGCPIIRVFAGKAPKGISEEQAIDNAVRNLGKACKRAGEKGIILALENHDFPDGLPPSPDHRQTGRLPLVRGQPGLRKFHRQGRVRSLRADRSLCRHRSAQGRASGRVGKEDARRHESADWNSQESKLPRLRGIGIRGQGRSIHGRSPTPQGIKATDRLTLVHPAVAHAMDGYEKLRIGGVRLHFLPQLGNMLV